MASHEQHYVVSKQFHPCWVAPRSDTPGVSHIPTGASGGNNLLRVHDIVELDTSPSEAPTVERRTYLGRLSTGWDVVITTDDAQKNYMVDMYLGQPPVHTAERSIHMPILAPLQFAAIDSRHAA